MTGLKGAMPVSAERRYENNVNEVQLMTQFFENDERITHHAMSILRMMGSICKSLFAAVHESSKEEQDARITCKLIKNF